MEDNFGKAMREYNQSERKSKRKRICDHEYTTKSSGWVICVTCGLYLKRTLSQDISTYLDRYSFSCPKKVHVMEIREKMSELMGNIVRKSACYEFIYPDGEIRHDSAYIEPPEAGLPRELFDYSEDLCQVCFNYKLPDESIRKTVKRGSPIHCQTRSLCAAVLWEKVKSLYPITKDEFSKKTGVSKLTITNTCKKMRQKDSN